MNWIDNAIGVHAQALVLRGHRAEVLAGNVANADTPHYRARDIDFKEAMGRARDAADPAVPRTTNSRHIGSHNPGAHFNMVFRETDQSTLNGNTVHVEVEQAEYTENAVKFQASAQFFDGALSGLRKALRGE
jgi:flagellar basal-body rod protein FlgB